MCPELSGVRIGAAPVHTAIGVDSAADACGESHVEDGREIASGAVPRLAEGADVGVVVHDYRHAKRLLELIGQRKITPSGRRAVDRYNALISAKSMGPPKPTPQDANVERCWRPVVRNCSDLPQHPCGAAIAIGGKRLAADHVGSLKRGE